MLPNAFTTSDIDAVGVQPSAVLEELLSAADKVAEELELPKGWLNRDDVGLYANSVPGRLEGAGEGGGAVR